MSDEELRIDWSATPNVREGQSPCSYSGPEYRVRGAALALGTIQMTVGLASVTTSLVLLICTEESLAEFDQNFLGHVPGCGIFGGVLFFITGILELFSGKGMPKKNLTISTLVLSVISACISGVFFSFTYGLTDTFVGASRRLRNGGNIAAIGIILSIIAILEAGVSTAGSVLCCITMNGYNKSHGIPGHVRQSHAEERSSHANDDRLAASSADRESRYNRYCEQKRPVGINRRAATILGVCQMMVGVVCLYTNVLHLISGRTCAKCASLFKIGYGIWGGVLFFITGLLLMMSGSRIAKMNLIVAAMLMCIITACCTPLVAALGFLDANYGLRGPVPDEFKNYAVASGMSVFVMGIVEAMLSVVSSVLCCRAACYESSNVTSTGHRPMSTVPNQYSDMPRKNLLST